MMTEPAYRRRWQTKLDWYRAQGVLLIEEGGQAGILVTTTEGLGIDSVSIEQRLRKVLAL